MALNQERSVAPVQVLEWRGLMTNMNPHMLPHGAAREQVNLSMNRQGIVEVRGGTHRVTFEN